jgi:hypothetical protein
LLEGQSIIILYENMAFDCALTNDRSSGWVSGIDSFMWRNDRIGHAGAGLWNIAVLAQIVPRSENAELRQ